MNGLTIQKLQDMVEHRYCEDIEFPDLILEQTPEEIQSDGIAKGITVDMQTANALITVYKVLNNENKDKFKRMLLTYSNFQRLVKFAWSKIT